MLRRINLSSAFARSSASRLQAYQSTGLWACCRRYGLVSSMSRFAMRSECLVERVGGYRPVRRIPDGLSLFDDDRLRRFVPDLKTFRNRIRQTPIFDNKHQTGNQFGSRFRKIFEVGVHVRAYWALRAMLENKNRIGFRP